MKKTIVFLATTILFACFFSGCGQSAQARMTASLSPNWQNVTGSGLAVSQHGTTLIYTFSDCTLAPGSISRSGGMRRS